jgi:hypothetical protein
MNVRAQRVLSLAVVASALIACGCVTTVQGGAQSVAQIAGPVCAEGAVAAGAGLGDATWAMAIVGEGSLGVDVVTGRAEGTLGSGLEYFRYEGEPDHAKHGNHVGLYSGARLGLSDRDQSFLLVGEYGHAWVLNVGREDGDHVTALSLDPMLGVSLPMDDLQRPAGLVLGVGVGLRFDSYSVWHFRM